VHKLLPEEIERLKDMEREKVQLKREAGSLPDGVSHCRFDISDTTRHALGQPCVIEPHPGQTHLYLWTPHGPQALL